MVLHDFKVERWHEKSWGVLSSEAGDKYIRERERERVYLTSLTSAAQLILMIDTITFIIMDIWNNILYDFLMPILCQVSTLRILENLGWLKVQEWICLCAEQEIRAGSHGHWAIISFVVLSSVNLGWYWTIVTMSLIINRAPLYR
jgi:hypothetical protein